MAGSTRHTQPLACGFQTNEPGLPDGVIVLGIRCTDKADFQFGGRIGLHIEQAKHSPAIRQRNYLRFTGSSVGHAVEGASEQDALAVSQQGPREDRGREKLRATSSSGCNQGRVTFQSPERTIE